MCCWLEVRHHFDGKLPAKPWGNIFPFSVTRSRSIPMTRKPAESRKPCCHDRPSSPQRPWGPWLPGGGGFRDVRRCGKCMYLKNGFHVGCLEMIDYNMMPWD